MKNIEIRQIEAGDTALIASAFQAIGWNKPESQYLNYLKEQKEGKRVVFLAFLDKDFAGYGNIIWSSSYTQFKEKEIPEISDLNVLPKFRRKGIATAIMDHAEGMIANQSQYAGIGFGLYADYGAAQQMYVRRGYIPDGCGITYEGKPVPPGQQVMVDDDLVLFLVKKLEGC